MLLPLSVLLEDILVTIAEIVLAATGAVLEIVLGEAVLHGISAIF